MLQSLPLESQYQPLHRKKRIAIFGVKYYPSRGGTSRVVEALLNELKEEYDFTVYCYQDQKAQDHLPNVRTIEFKPSRIKGLGVFWYYWRCYRHLRRQKDFDLVHIHKIDAAFFFPLLNRRFKTIVTSHALPYLNDKWSRIGKLYFRLAERMFMNRRGTQTAISIAHQQHFESTYHQKIRYIPNGIDLDTPFDMERSGELLAKHQIQDGFLFFAARRIIPLKGLHTLLAALKQIRYQGQIVVAGDMDQMKGYSQEIIQQSQGLNVAFIGYVGDKPTLLGLIKRAGMFVFPSELEGMSIMLLEAASTHSPMLCSDIPANTHIFNEDEVLYFRSTDVRHLAEKLTWALSHPEQMQEKAQNALIKVHNQYSRKVMAMNYAELYEDIIAQ